MATGRRERQTTQRLKGRISVVFDKNKKAKLQGAKLNHKGREKLNYKGKEKKNIRKVNAYGCKSNFDHLLQSLKTPFAFFVFQLQYSFEAHQSFIDIFFIFQSFGAIVLIFQINIRLTTAVIRILLKRNILKRSQ